MLSDICVRRPVFATMLVMSFVVLGIFSFRDLGVDLFPKADPATVNVQLSLPGTSPDEMATSVVEPMEEALSGVAGIDEISARMNEGTATITVRFVLERDLNDAANDVREKVASAMKAVPPQLLPPVITKVDPDSDPVMSLVVSSDSMSLRTLTEIADKQIMRVIQTAGGVGQVTMGGGRAREVHVVVDIQKLNAYGLSLTQVSDAIETENVEIPGGAVEQGNGQLLLRTLGRVDVTEGLQQRRHRHDQRHADPRLGRRLCRRHLPAADDGGVAGRRPGGRPRHPPRDGREHRGGDRRGARQDPDAAADAAQGR
jgi:HAE1 family hydrophobic/amphiphilic exporter-1